MSETTAGGGEGQTVVGRLLFYSKATAVAVDGWVQPPGTSDPTPHTHTHSL
jgi:hypothetical protein